MQLSPVEIRIIGCLLEKQRTTPDGYPLSLNALRAACNQSTNRDPVVDYDEATIREALGELGRRHWIRSASGHGGRALKYRHLLGDELPLPEPQLSLLAVLMLRGAQTPGELKQRVERLHPFPDLAAAMDGLEGLVERKLVARLPRRPGQKEERYEQLLGGDAEGEDAAAGNVEPDGPSAVEPPRVAPPVAGSGELQALQRTIAELGERLEAVERRLDAREGS